MKRSVLRNNIKSSACEKVCVRVLTSRGQKGSIVYARSECVCRLIAQVCTLKKEVDDRYFCRRSLFVRRAAFFFRAELILFITIIRQVQIKVQVQAGLTDGEYLLRG